MSSMSNRIYAEHIYAGVYLCHQGPKDIMPAIGIEPIEYKRHVGLLLTVTNLPKSDRA